MKIFLIIATVMSILTARTVSQQSVLAQQQNSIAKKESPFACVPSAFTPKERKRHFEELGPALRSVNKSILELDNGFEFEFPSDKKTFQLVTEWVDGERLCCPFFDINVRLEREGGSLWLRLTGREGTKEFIKEEFSPWFKK